MSEEYSFREIRKGEREAVLTFANRHGLKLMPGDLCHHLSLTVERGDQIIAAALCIQHDAGQVVVEIVVGDSDIDESLIGELADRCLRKVQSEDIAAARIHSPTKQPTEALWSSASWLNQVEETAPPDAKLPVDDSSQAA